MQIQASSNLSICSSQHAHIFHAAHLCHCIHKPHLCHCIHKPQGKLAMRMQLSCFLQEVAMFSMYREPSSNSLLLVPRAARLRIRNGPRNLALLEAKKSLAWTNTLQRCVFCDSQKHFCCLQCMQQSHKLMQ